MKKTRESSVNKFTFLNHAAYGRLTQMQLGPNKVDSIAVSVFWLSLTSTESLRDQIKLKKIMKKPRESVVNNIMYLLVFTYFHVFFYMFPLLILCSYVCSHVFTNILLHVFTCFSILKRCVKPRRGRHYFSEKTQEF